MDQDKSKSQTKREMKALQELGVRLTQLTPSQLAEIPVPEELLEAIDQYKRISSGTAKKRQAQFIGKIIRSLENIDNIKTAYEKVTKGLSVKSEKLHLVEDWRERLLSEDKSAITEFMQQHEVENAQQLRQLIRKAKAEREQQKNMGANKALFQFIKNLIT